jgi:hypothetical protein
MNPFLFLLALFSYCSQLIASASLVFIHLGPTLPPHLPTAISQARLFNPDCSIYLLANAETLQRNPLSHDLRFVECISVETLPFSKIHKKFRAQSKLDKTFRNGFWTFTLERFFYLSALMQQRRLTDVFHIENDVMLYADLVQLLPIFQRHFPHQIAAIFDNDLRCVPSFLYIAERKPLKKFLQRVANHVHQGGTDMEYLGKFRQEFEKQYIDSLPILPPNYPEHHPLISPSGVVGTNPERYFHLFDEFQGIFDAAAIGQYLGGIDPIHTSRPTVGFINEAAIFDPSKLTFSWRKDEQGRKVPYLEFQSISCPIYNLHIHSKNLTAFYSGEFP